MAENQLTVLVLGAAGLIAVVLVSLAFMLYSIKSSLHTIEETLDDLREIDLEIARRLWQSLNSPATQAAVVAESPEPGRSQDDQAPPPPSPAKQQDSSLRNQAEQIRRRLQD